MKNCLLVPNLLKNTLYTVTFFTYFFLLLNLSITEYCFFQINLAQKGEWGNILPCKLGLLFVMECQLWARVEPGCPLLVSIGTLVLKSEYLDIVDALKNTSNRFFQNLGKTVSIGGKVK